MLPEKLEIVVLLGNNFTISDPYSLFVDFWKNKSILIKSAELKTFNSQNNEILYEIEAIFDFISDETFNITYGCSSPFTLTLASKNSWDLYWVDCEAILIHTLQEGTTEFSLTTELRPING